MGSVTDHELPSYSELGGDDRSELEGQLAAQQERVDRRLSRVDRVVAILSGKGGVGKTFVAAGLAAALQEKEWRVGMLDADLDSPTLPRFLGVRDARLHRGSEGYRPVTAAGGLRVVSTALLLEEDAPLRWSGPRSEEFVWRGAQERGVLREFLSDVEWGSLDLLLVDLPPGAGRFEQLAGLVPGMTGVLGVTLPAEASGSSVGRTLRTAEERGVPLLGVVENMAGYVCPDCGTEGRLFPGGAGERLSEAAGVPLLGRVPFDPRAAGYADDGAPGELLTDTAAGRSLAALASAFRGSLRS